METTSLQEATDLLNNFEQAIRENDLVKIAELKTEIIEKMNIPNEESDVFEPDFTIGNKYIDEIVERYKHLKVNLVHPKK